MTLELPDDSPVLSMPWIITFGPLSDEEEWEPVVCGPYERQHALALAEEIVADEELMAVVEPLQPLVDVERIREEIVLARTMAEEEDADEDTDLDVGLDELAGPGGALAGEGLMAGEGALAGEGPLAGEVEERAAPPTPAEIRAGFARIAARLTGAH